MQSKHGGDGALKEKQNTGNPCMAWINDHEGTHVGLCNVFLLYREALVLLVKEIFAHILETLVQV